MSDEPQQCLGSDGCQRSRRSSWGTLALVAGIGGTLAVVVAGSVVTTLALTHQSAVRENFIAYANGLTDGYSRGFSDGAWAAAVAGLA